MTEYYGLNKLRFIKFCGNYEQWNLKGKKII